MLGLLALLAVNATAASATSTDTAGAMSPDFDAVTWTALTCNNADLIAHTSPAPADFVGDATFAPAYFAHDDSYLYFRYRMNANPGTFAQYAWSALMQVPSGDPYQYQYRLCLNGKSNTIEIWQNTVAQDIDFSSVFNDRPEVQLFSQKYNLTDNSTVNTTPLARSLSTTDGSYFGGDSDYFLDFAFPVSVMVADGLIASPADLDQALFFPVTSTEPINYNKGHLNCPFLPVANLSVSVAVTPDEAPVKVTTPVEFTITVHNDGVIGAKGLVIDNSAFPPYLSNFMVLVFSDPSVTPTVTSTNPLQVQVPSLPGGATLTIRVRADAKPDCKDSDFTDVVTVSGVNLMPMSGSAVLHVPGCVPCTTAADCNDGNGCTTDTCSAGACAHTTIPGCVPCTAAADCEDGNACTTETCDAGACAHATIPGCVPCTTAADCNGGNGCTTDTCDAGACAYATIPGCVPCTTAADCDDTNACTTDTCDAGACAHASIPGCVPCTTAADCDDHNGCTADNCDAGACAYVAIADCVPCTTAADCDDHNACTTEMCSANGICEHQRQEGCIPCTTAADCNDQNPCTTDTCGPDGSCRFSAIAGCQRCATAADCNDGDACTTDTCTGGVCAHTGVPGCGPEQCSDGVDNDGDGLVDCVDPDCANAPECQPKQEICGNCIDDDGDGLVDYEDPDCCAQTLPLTMKRMLLKPMGIHVHGNRLKLKGRYSASAARLFDPTAQDTTLQISDADGQLFCQTIAAAHWKHPHRRLYRFTDKKAAFAGGLQKGRFKVKRNGTVLFRTRGKKVELRASDGDDVMVTVRVGDQCARERMNLRTTKKALIFP